MDARTPRAVQHAPGRRQERAARGQRVPGRVAAPRGANARPAAVRRSARLRRRGRVRPVSLHGAAWHPLALRRREEATRATATPVGIWARGAVLVRRLGARLRWALLRAHWHCRMRVRDYLFPHRRSGKGARGRHDHGESAVLPPSVEVRARARPEQEHRQGSARRLLVPRHQGDHPTHTSAQAALPGHQGDVGYQRRGGRVHTRRHQRELRGRVRGRHADGSRRRRAPSVD